MSIFKDFQGADLDRLVKCIEAIRKEDLSLDEHCQAGINQSSGNVFIWSEDWSGCIYCSIGFNVHWSYSCPECGEEYDFDSEADCRSYAEQCHYKCVECV